MRRKLMKQISNRRALEEAGRNTSLSFNERYFANVMAEQARQNIDDWRSRLLGRNVRIVLRHRV